LSLDTSPDTGTVPAQQAPKPGPVIALLVAAAFVVILNETTMSVALTDIMIDLGVTTASAQWLTTGFLLTMAIVIPLTGFLLSRFTIRQVFFSAMSLFALGTLIAGLAPGLEVLIVGRVVQAMGTGVMMPLLELKSKFLKPAYYDQELTIKTSVKQLPGIRIHFEYELFNEAAELINIGHTTLVFFDMEKKKPCHPPENFMSRIAQYFD